jgi:hypothetical protein
MPNDHPDISPEDLFRLRTTFALRRLSKEMQSSVLSDGTIASKVGIDVSHPIRLPDGITIDRTLLFDAFRCAADQEPASEIVDVNGVRRNMEVEIERDDAVLVWDKNRVKFPQAALLSGNFARRMETAARITARSTLTVEARAEFEAFIAKEPFAHDDFFAACEILLGAPESFSDSLMEAARAGPMKLLDLLPQHDAYWENIAARRLSSESCSDFVLNELAAARKTHMDSGGMPAIEAVSLLFGSYELVPLALLEDIDAGSMLDALERLRDFADPHALAGALEICADASARDARFVELGDRIIDTLVGDPKRILCQFATYAAAYIVATTHLAKHENLRTQPVYWRRLVASAHAALVTRLLGAADDEHQIFDSAMRFRGKSFYLSVMFDAYTEPRWRPDWITPQFLAADLYGRLYNTVHRLGENAPASWRARVEKAESEFRFEGLPPLARAYPSLLQGGRLPPAELPPADTGIGELFAEFALNPTVEKFLMFQQFAEAFGFPPAARESALLAIKDLGQKLATIEPIQAQAALLVGAHIAATNRDVALADEVASAAVESLVSMMEPERLMLTAAVLLKCAGATVGRSDALTTLARRLESMTHIAPAAVMPDAIEVFEILQSVSKDLSPLLGRAMAAAKLGSPRITDN